MSESGLRAFWGSSYNLGGCNNCSRHMTEHGQASHQVLNVQLEKGASFRLCELCLVELDDARKQANSRLSKNNE